MGYLRLLLNILASDPPRDRTIHPGFALLAAAQAPQNRSLFLLRRLWFSGSECNLLLQFCLLDAREKPQNICNLLQFFTPNLPSIY